MDNLIPEIMKKYFDIDWDNVNDISEKFYTQIGNCKSKAYVDGFGVVYKANNTSKYFGIAMLLTREKYVEKIPKWVEPLKHIIENGAVYKYVDSDGIVRTIENNCETFDYMCLTCKNMFPYDAEIPQEQIDDIVKRIKGE